MGGGQWLDKVYRGQISLLFDFDSYKDGEFTFGKETCSTVSLVIVSMFPVV